MLVNPGAGGGGALDSVGEAFAAAGGGHRVEACPPDELDARVAGALAAGVGFVGIAGGDGTVGSVAGALVDGEVPLLVVPAGTRNHFAHDLGVDTLEAAAALVGDSASGAGGGVVRTVTVGQVADRTFVNNASLGLYPVLVRHRERHESRLGKRRATVRAAAEIARRGRPLRVVVDGRTRRAWAVFVGNGRYGDGPFAVTSRGALDGDELDVRVLRADRRWSRPRLVGALLVAAGERAQVVDAWRASEVSIELAESSVRRVPVAVDGEVVELEPPLRFTVRTRCLPVLAPATGEAARPAGRP